TVSQFSIGAAGSMAPLTPAQVPTGTDPSSMATTPSGQYAYVLNFADLTLSQFSLGTQGALTPLSPATIPAPYRGGITLDPSGANLYVLDSFSGNVAQYTT